MNKPRNPTPPDLDAELDALLADRRVVTITEILDRLRHYADDPETRARIAARLKWHGWSKAWVRDH